MTRQTLRWARRGEGRGREALPWGRQSPGGAGPAAEVRGTGRTGVRAGPQRVRGAGGGGGRRPPGLGGGFDTVPHPRKQNHPQIGRGAEVRAA